MDEASKFLNEHYHTLFILLCGMVLTWIAANRYFHWAGRVKKAEDDCKKIDGHIVPRLTSIDNSINSLNGSFKGLVIHLQTKNIIYDPNIFMTRSPIQLTPFGWELLSAIGGKSYIDENIEALISEMDLQGVTTALDTQIISPVVITKVSANDNFKHIKDYVFNNPIFKSKNPDGSDIIYPMDMGKVATIMGIYLRDKYLERHPEFNPDDIPSIVPKSE